MVLSAGPTPRTPTEQVVEARHQLDGQAVTYRASSRAAGTDSDAASTPEMLARIGPSAAQRPRIYICGPTAFVEHVADLLIDLGHPPMAIRAERFGPTS